MLRNNSNNNNNNNNSSSDNNNNTKPTIEYNNGSVDVEEKYKKLNSGDASIYASNNEGYGETLSGEAGSDRNISTSNNNNNNSTNNNDNLVQTSATDTQEQFGLDGNGTSVNDFNDNYDPAQYENYYYQDEDGNCYYYADPQQQEQQLEEDQQQQQQEQQQQELSEEQLQLLQYQQQQQQMMQLNDPNAMYNQIGLPDGYMIGPDGRLIPSTANGALHLHELENWEPVHYNWFADIVVDTFVNIVYKVYLTILLYCAGVLIAIMGLDYSFASLYRTFVPPDPTRNAALQVLCYASIFCYLSFVIVSAFCVMIDMLHNLWRVKREDQVFWGMSHKCISKSKPPYWIYFVIILATVFLPILWGIIDAGINHQSVVFVAQRYANVAVLATTFIVIVCYLWFYWRALKEKYYAIKRRRIMDDFVLRARAYRHKPHKMTKTHWYHASHVLEEFGVDGKTLRYNCVVFTIGCVPIFALYTAQCVRTFNGNPSVVYAFIACIALMCIYLLAWLSIFHLKGQWSVYCAFCLIALFVVLGAAGAGASGAGVGVGVVLVLFVASQGSLTRKRTHILTRRELCTLLHIPFAPPSELAGPTAAAMANHDAHNIMSLNNTVTINNNNSSSSNKNSLLKHLSSKNKGKRNEDMAHLNHSAANYNSNNTRMDIHHNNKLHSLMPDWHEMRVDTYLCCCHEVLLNYLRCFNVKRIFGYTHPEVKRASRLYAQVHIALRTDQKVLFVWWIIVMFAVAFTIGLGNGVMYSFSEPIAAVNTTTTSSSTNSPATDKPTNDVSSDMSTTSICKLHFNSNGAASLKIYDLALLSALSYTYGANGNVDFATWFSHVPTFIRQYPIRLPTSFNNATNNITVPFSDYVDVSSGFHVITLNSNTRGMALFRDVDDWSESMAFQAAASISPLMMIWPERYRLAFVQSAALFKKWFQASYALDEVRNYTRNLLQHGTRTSNILLVGDQFNGGYAKLLASELNLTFVAFNPPGVKYKISSIMNEQPLNGTQLTAIRGLWSYIDSLEDSTNTVYMSCSPDYSANLCGRITTTIDYIYRTCGDPYNRYLTSATT